MKDDDAKEELAREENVGEIDNAECSSIKGSGKEGVKEMTSVAAHQPSEWYRIFLNLMDRSVVDSLT